MKEQSKPLVSIICTTYNHELFIVDCLEGLVNQQTNFKFEIIVHDDASKDNTSEILKSYEVKYPELFNNIYQTENQYSKGTVNIWTDILFPRAKGKYIAICEGDDYWSDYYKLQKQVDFLEQNPSYSLCVGGYSGNSLQTGDKFEAIYNRKVNDAGRKGFSFDLEDMKHRWFFSTLTAVFVNRPALLAFMKRHKYARDIHLFYYCMKLGDGFYFKESLGVYNIHSNGVFSGIEESKRIKEHHMLYKDIWEVNKDDFSRHVYYRVILNYFNASFYNRNITKNLRFSVGLLLSSFPLIKNFKDILYFFYRLLPPFPQTGSSKRQ